MTYERDNIRRMHAYEWGEQPDSAEVLKLNTNENPFPPGPRVQDALAHFDVANLRRYPPPTADRLRGKLARLHGLDIRNFVVTNGGDEGLRLALTTFVEPGTPLGTLEPSYSLYPVLADVQGAPTLKIPLGDDWSIPSDFARRLNDAGANLACIVNPHAPSGTLTDAESISRIASVFRGVLLVDEAYADFVDPELGYDLVRLVDELDNLLILRTFSKGYSLAGARLGYLIGSPDLVAPILGKTRDSYNVNLVSQILGEAALDDIAYARETWAQIRAARQALKAALTTLGCRVGASQTNFLLAEIPPEFPLCARDIYRSLKARGVLIRYFDTPLMQNRLRISVGTSSQNDRVVSLLREILSGARA